MTNQSIRRLTIISQYFYPEEFRINDLAFEWVKRGYDVTVITGIPNYPKGRFFSGYGWLRKNREVIQGVKVIRLPILPRRKGLIFFIAELFVFCSQWLLLGFIYQTSK